MFFTPAFLAMALANFCTVTSLGAFFLFPLFITARGGTAADIGIHMGAFALASALCRPWISEMIDRLGRKRSYTLGCLLMTLLPLVYPLFEGDLAGFYLPLLAVRVAHGVGLAICFTAAFTFIADIVPPERLNEGIGLFGISGLIGLAVGPMLGEAVITRCGFTSFFVAAAALAGLGLLAHLPLADPYLPSAVDASPSFFTLLRRRPTLRMAGLALIFGFGLAATGNFVAPLVQQRRLGLVSTYYLAYSIAAVLVRFGGGRLADRVGERRILPFALAVTAGGLLLLPLAGGPAWLIMAGLMSGAGHGLLFPSLNALAVRDEPGASRGKLTGVFTGAIDGGAFAGSLLLGYLGEWLGLPAIFFAAGSVLLLGIAVTSSRTWARI